MKLKIKFPFNILLKCFSISQRFLIVSSFFFTITQLNSHEEFSISCVLKLFAWENFENCQKPLRFYFSYFIYNRVEILLFRKRIPRFD